MSRSGYNDDFDGWALIRWRGAVNSALKGARGQLFLRDLLSALDALPQKRLIANQLAENNEVCAIGALGLARGLDMTKIDPEDPDTVANIFDIAPSMAREIVFMNDEWGDWRETPEHRFSRMRRYVESLLQPPPSAFRVK